MLLTAVGLLLVVVAAWFVAWPLFRDDDGAPPDSTSARETELAALVAKRDQALGALKDADFDHRVGKLSDDDYASLCADLERRALEALSALEVRAPETAPGDVEPSHTAAPSESPQPRAAPSERRGATARAPREKAAFCASCGRHRTSASRFCSGCGAVVDGDSNRKRA